MLGNDLLKDLMADLRPDRTRGAIYGKTMDFPGKSGSPPSTYGKTRVFPGRLGLFDPHVIEKKACFGDRAYAGDAEHVRKLCDEGHPYRRKRRGGRGSE